MALTPAIDWLARRRTTLVTRAPTDLRSAADRVVVIGAGSVLEVGTHAELLAAEGAYARLWDYFVDPSGEKAQVVAT